MKHGPRPLWLSYSNVMSTLCFFLLVSGGAAYAATHLGKNSVGTRQLKEGSVTGLKVKDKTLTGKDIDLATLGTAPVPTLGTPPVPTLGTPPSPTDAHTVGGLSAPQLLEASRVHCPPGTEPVAGVCFESEARESAGITTALITCAQANRRLPSEAELIAFGIQYYQTQGKSEWAEPVYVTDGPEMVGIALKASKEGGFGFSLTATASTPMSYRCVTTGSN